VIRELRLSPELNIDMPYRHCEEQSDEAISNDFPMKRDCFVGLRPSRNDERALDLGHGGNFLELCDYFKISPEKAIDFSASINPLGFPKGVESFLAARLSQIKHYPDIKNEKVLSSLSEYLNIPAGNILAGNGSMEILDWVLRTLKPESVKIVNPAFSEYRRLAENCGAKITEAHESADLIFVAHPGNPMGNLLTSGEFKNLLNSCRWLVVDEAFVEFAGEEHSYVHEVLDFSRLIVIRSATKFFSIPGLRLGYAVASEEMIASLRKFQLPWSINSLAQEAAAYIFSDTQFQNQSREFVAGERAWLSQNLALLGWIKTYPSSANYLLCEIKGDALELFHQLGAKGCFIRPCHNFAGLGARFFRVAVRTRKENECLIEAMSKL